MPVLEGTHAVRNRISIGGVGRGSKPGRHRAPRSDRRRVRSRALLSVLAASAVLAGGATVNAALEPTASQARTTPQDEPSRTLPAGSTVRRVTVPPSTRLAHVRKLRKRLAAEQLARKLRHARERAARSARRAAVDDPRSAARTLASARHGWGAGEFSCLEALWQKESGWDYRAANPSSGAYGIPQALPGSKMATKGGDWRTNPLTQIAWGLDYIEGSYGSPCGAWSHSQSSGWY